MITQKKSLRIWSTVKVSWVRRCSCNVILRRGNSTHKNRHSKHTEIKTVGLIVMMTLNFTQVNIFRKKLLVGWLIDSYRPGKQFFSHVGTEPPLPGYYQYFWGVEKAIDF